MKLQEFKDHLRLAHSGILDKMKDGSLQEFYAAAQRHRQEHLRELDEHTQSFRYVPEPLDHWHTQGPNFDDKGKEIVPRAVALGSRDIFL